MSVSDPLIKLFKNHVKNLKCSENQVITDGHDCLQPLCESLEAIFRQGIIQNTKPFFLGRRDYWSWIDNINDSSSNPYRYARIEPLLSLILTEVRANKKVTSLQGRGRLFIRIALQKRVLPLVIKQLEENWSHLQSCYHPNSIIADEILREIFLSALCQLNTVDFKLNIKNSSFLDDTWIIPKYRQYEFVPSKDLGVRVILAEGHCLVTSVEENSVAGENNRIEIGDAIDELLGQSFRTMSISKAQSLLKENKGYPIFLGVVKAKMTNGYVFPPISDLIKLTDIDLGSIEKQAKDEYKKRSNKETPAHTILPEDEYDKIPVSNSTDSADYYVKYVGAISVGSDGGVHQIEKAIGNIIKQDQEKSLDEYQNVGLALGEKDVIVTDSLSNKILFKHSYTEIASCGRRLDNMLLVAYIAGETTCSFAKDFKAYVFRASDRSEAKDILCSIAQGFDRTHFFV